MVRRTSQVMHGNSDGANGNRGRCPQSEGWQDAARQPQMGQHSAAKRKDKNCEKAMRREPSKAFKSPGRTYIKMLQNNKLIQILPRVFACVWLRHARCCETRQGCLSRKPLHRMNGHGDLFAEHTFLDNTNRRMYSMNIYMWQSRFDFKPLTRYRRQKCTFCTKPFAWQQRRSGQTHLFNDMGPNAYPFATISSRLSLQRPASFRGQGGCSICRS